MPPSHSVLVGRLRSLLRPRALRIHLTAIVIVALVPALAVGAAGAWLAINSYQRAYDNRLSDTAGSVALLLNREIANHTATLAALSASPALDQGPDGDLAAFHAHARRAAAAVGSLIVLVGPDLRVRLNTDAPVGAVPSTLATTGAARETFATGQPGVSALTSGIMSRSPAVIVTVPVVREGRVLAVLGTKIDPFHLSSLLAASNLSGEAVATVVDGRNIIVARSRMPERFIGREAPAWYAQALAGRQDGLASGVILDGTDVKLAFQQVPGTPNWTLAVLEPGAVFATRSFSPVLTLVLGGAVALVVALNFAMWLGARVLAPIAVLRQRAEAVAAGGGSLALAPALPSRRYLEVTEFEALGQSIGRAGLVLSASERRHRAIAEADAAALWRARADGHVIESRGWELVTGQRPEELQGRGWTQALHPDDVAPTLAAWQEAMERKTVVNAEFRVRRVDGQWLWYSTRGVPILDARNEIEEWYGVVINIHDRKEVASALVASEARLRALVDTAPDAIVVMDTQGIVHSFNQGAEKIFAYDAAEIVGRNISMLMPQPHAALHDSYLAHYDRTGERRVVGSVTKVEGLRRDGRRVPLEASIGEWRDAAGTRFFTGVLRDVAERRAAEERQTMLAREVDHRAKNALAVVLSVLRLTKADTMKAFAAAVEARVSALARAHSLLAQEGWAAAELRTLAERELAAHAHRQGQEDMVRLDGPSFPIGSVAVQPIAMVLHELATNAAKHGALSTPSGRVRLRWSACADAGLLTIRWQERGGPPVAQPARRGFGSRVIETTVAHQLGGKVQWWWEESGLICQITVPIARVSPSAVEEEA